MSLRLRRPDGDEGKDAVEVELQISQGGVSRRSFSVVFLSASSDESENTGDTSVTSICSDGEAFIIDGDVSSEMLSDLDATATVKRPSSCGELGIDESSWRDQKSRSVK